MVDYEFESAEEKWSHFARTKNTKMLAHGQQHDFGKLLIIKWFFGMGTGRIQLDVIDPREIFPRSFKRDVPSI